MKKSCLNPLRPVRKGPAFWRKRKGPAIAIGVTLAVCSVGLGFATRRVGRSIPLVSRGGASAAPRAYWLAPIQGKPLDHKRLAVQPMADRLRRRLGQRFASPGHEATTMTGTLTIGGIHHQVTIVRIQDDGGERASIALDNGAANLTWDGIGGAVSGGNAAAGGDRSLIERLALDSPDQFIMAQLRAASYYTVALSARPESAGGDESYTGPIWDIVRVEESARGNPNLPLSNFRLYHINVGTGLLDKIVSVEQGQTVEADILSWANQGGEMVPTHISWKQGSQVLMDLALAGAAFTGIQ